MFKGYLSGFPAVDAFAVVGEVTMCDLWQRTRHVPSCCSEYNIVVSSSSGRDYLDQAATGGAAYRLATPADLRLLGYLAMLRCCICRNFAHN